MRIILIQMKCLCSCDFPLMSLTYTHTYTDAVLVKSFPSLWLSKYFFFVCICVSENFLLWCDGLMDGRVFLLSSFFYYFFFFFLAFASFCCCLRLSREEEIDERNCEQGFSCLLMIIFTLLRLLDWIWDMMSFF